VLPVLFVPELIFAVFALLVSVVALVFAVVVLLVVVEFVFGEEGLLLVELEVSLVGEVAVCC
jgi:hypothetical protein